MKTTLSAKRYVFTKTNLRRTALTTGRQIAWETSDGRLVGRSIPVDVLEKLTGIDKGRPDLVAELLKQRRQDREREDRKLAR